MINVVLGGKPTSMVLHMLPESQSWTEVIAAEAESTTPKYSSVVNFAESSETQDKVHGLMLTAEQEAASLRLLALQDNIFISVVSEFGDSVGYWESRREP